ncbi:MAG: class I SAM-dependent methyltransferase [Nocardioidaceae bacterium]|nr:class I SAM-dependent methyltransferase [Nocardioidaceae bacterium]
MSELNTPDPALCFGGVVDAYDRARPGYPPEAARWLTGGEPLTVLELGAGTGKLTEQLIALGHDVHATDPDPAMLDRLTLKFPELRVSQSTAEEIPAPDASIDVVVVAQAYQWFDKERALPEIARVLKRGGTLALVWNTRDERIPWVKRFGRLIGRQDQDHQGPDEALEDSPYFGPIEEESFKHWQVVDRDSVQDLVLSRSNVATLSAEGRAAKLREVVAFYDDFGRGMDGMQIPYVTRCFRAVVAVRPQRPAPPPVEADPEATDPNGVAVDGEETAPLAADYLRRYDDTGSLPAQNVLDPEPPRADDDSGVLLINFR